MPSPRSSLDPRRPTAALLGLGALGALGLALASPAALAAEPETAAASAAAVAAEAAPAPVEPAAAPEPATPAAATPGPPTVLAAAEPLSPPAAAAGPMPSAAKATPPPAPAAPAAPPPPPYSLPWQLRPLTVGNVVRSDTVIAFFKNPAMTADSGNTVATMLLASYKLTPSFAPMLRIGVVSNTAPGMIVDGNSFVNPIVGGTYSHKLGSFRLAGFLATTIPIGLGAGDMPDQAAARANADGIAARSAMDNAMFAVNYMTGIAGVGFGYIDHKLTVQAEATVLQLFRVRGDNAPSAQDSARTNSTAGLHLGYFLIPELSLGGEIRYQRWLTRPTMMGTKINSDDMRMDTLTFAVGPRGHFKLGKTMWVRPGIAYARALDAPLTRSSYNMVQVDIPIVF